MELPGRRSRAFPLGDRIAAAAAVGLVAVQALGQDGARAGGGRAFDLGAAVLLALAIGLAAAGRRTPATGAIGALAVVMLWYQLGYTSGIVHVPYLVAFYRVGASGDRRRQLAAGGIAVVAATAAILASGDEPASTAAAAVGWTLAAILLGELTHSRRALLDEYEARALRAEAERDAEAERRVAQARLEIARDLHDVLAHTVSVMTVQAGVAQDALARGRDGAGEALSTIRTAGREAMEEVQALVALLRGDEPPATAPAPGLDRLAELATATRAAGVAVDLRADTNGAALSDVAQLTAYRVVQESLTNVVRHSGSDRASVEVYGDGGDLVVLVRDGGRGGPAGPAGAGGFGVAGMRERVEALGGRLEAGPTPGGGWQVAARIPGSRGRPA